MKEDRRNKGKKGIWILSLVLVGIVFVVALCLGKSVQSGKNAGEGFADFPLDEKGYPREDVLQIEEEYYEMPLMRNAYGDTAVSHRLEVRKQGDSETIHIVLPRRSPTHRWSLEETEDIRMIGYQEVECAKRKGEKEVLEGVSDILQVFEVSADYDTDHEIRFKWCNINEVEKSFEEKKENYLLRIKVLRRK